MSDIFLYPAQIPHVESLTSILKRSIVANKITELNNANASNNTLKKNYENAIAAEKAKADTILNFKIY